jgi:hypothetical protein
VVWFCADAAVIMASVSAAMVSVFIASFSLLRKCGVKAPRIVPASLHF